MMPKSNTMTTGVTIAASTAEAPRSPKIALRLLAGIWDPRRPITSHTWLAVNVSGPRLDPHHRRLADDRVVEEEPERGGVFVHHVDPQGVAKVRRSCHVTGAGILRSAEPVSKARCGELSTVPREWHATAC